MATRLINRVLETLQQSATRQRGDGELLAAFTLRREEAAFTALVRRHGPMVLGVCRRVLRDVHLAEDAFQATFLVLARKAATLRQRDLVGNWLFGVAYRTALEARRLQARRGVHEKQVKAMPDSIAEPASDDELRKILDQELARLPDKYRAPLVLCDLEGRTRRDAAKHLQLPESTLSNRLTAARRLLARRLTRQGFALSAGALASIFANQSGAAPLSGALLAATSQAVVGACTVSSTVTLLTEAVMKSLLLAKCKIGAMVIVGVTMIGLATFSTTRPLPALNAAAAHDPVVIQTPIDPRAAQPVQAGAADAPRVFKGHTHGVDALAFSPDGKYLASGSLGVVKIWDVGAGKEVAAIQATKQYVKSLAYTQDGKFLISGSWDNDVGNVKVWETSGWREVRSINTGDALVHSVAVSPDGASLATGGREKVLKIWDLKTGQLKHAINAHPRDIQGVAYSADGKVIATCGHDSFVKLWDAETGRAIHVINNRNDAPHWDGVAFSPGSLHYVAACGVTLRLFDLRRGQEAWPDVVADETMTHCLAFSPDGKRLASGGSSKAVKLWDVETGKQLVTWKGHADRVVAVAFSPDGAWLASSSANNGEIRLWPVPGAKTRPTATDVREGVVTQVGHEDGLVQVTLWESHGLKKGDTLEVFRLKPAPQYVGQLRLLELQDRKAIGRFVGVGGRNVEVNDRVVRSLVRDNEPAAKAPAKAELQATRDRMVIEEQRLTDMVKETIRVTRREHAIDSTRALKMLRTAFLQVWDHPDISERLREQLLNRLAAARHDLTTEK